MTREMQDTERALVRAEHDWLKARGWRVAVVSGHGGHADRFAHPAAPQARESYSRRDALAITRGDPLRYTSRRHVTPGPA